MWVYQYQPLLNGLLQKALVELCTQSLPWEGRLEIDGIFCVSGKDPTQQIVIKIHKALEKPESKNAAKPSRKDCPPGNKKVVIEAGKIVSQGQGKSGKKAPGGKSPLPLNLSLPNLKSGASVTSNKSLTVGNQSLRALLGTKAAAGASVSLTETTGDDESGLPTILKQPQRHWLQRDGDHDTESETGSGQPDLFTVIKDEPQDAESESSLDLDEETLPATNVTCKICSIDFESFQKLHAHTLELHKRYACRQCCNTFSLRCNLRRHERLHAGVKPHVCTFCRQSFSRSADLRAHIRKHDAEKTPDWVACSKCPKSFRNAVNLRLHMYKVHKEKDCVYACSICEKVFHDADEFQIHRESHTASLVQAGKLPYNSDSARSTPLINGSQDSMDDAGMSSEEESACDFQEMDSLVRSAGKDNDFAEELHKARHPQVSALSGMDPQSPSSGDKSMSPLNSQGNSEELGLYFGSPLVIKEENDSNDTDSVKKSSRRKSKPIKFVERVEVEDDTENMAPAPGAETDDGSQSVKREADGADGEVPDNKRPRLQPELLLGEGFGIADQSLEAIMKQVNENLYKNKDVLIAEEKEKETEKKGKGKGSRYKSITPKKPNEPSTSMTSTPKTNPPIVLLVGSGQVVGANPKIAISRDPKSTADPLQVNLVKRDSSNWSVTSNASVKPKKNASIASFSPIPHDMVDQANKETDIKEYVCGMWGCNFACVGFQSFEDHTLSSHGRYPCKFCSQTFTGRNNRTRHIRYHWTGKQHQCADCGKFFARADSLKEHRFIHTKSYRDSNCCNCKIYFEKKATLLSHMKKCFSDSQLLTDKLSPEEIEREANIRNEPKESKSKTPTPKTKDNKTAVKPILPSQPNVPSDVGVMKAEYLLKEKQKIMDVKNYLDNQMAAMETVLDAAAAAPTDLVKEEDDVTVIDLDEKTGKPKIPEEARAEGGEEASVGFSLLGDISSAVSKAEDTEEDLETAEEEEEEDEEGGEEADDDEERPLVMADGDEPSPDDEDDGSVVEETAADDLMEEEDS